MSNVVAPGILKAHKEITRSISGVFEKSMKEVKSAIERNLNCGAEEILQLSRYYICCSETAPPFCFEMHKEVDVKPLLEPDFPTKHFGA